MLTILNAVIAGAIFIVLLGVADAMNGRSSGCRRVAVTILAIGAVAQAIGTFKQWGEWMDTLFFIGVLAWLVFDRRHERKQGG